MFGRRDQNPARWTEARFEGESLSDISLPKGVVLGESTVTFRIPKESFREDLLREVLPASASDYPVIGEIIQRELTRYTETPHNISDLRERLQVLSGTNILASEGFIESPHELLEAIMTRYAMLMVVGIDIELLKRIAEEPSRLVANQDSQRLSVEPASLSEGSFGVELEGETFEALYRKTYFLRQPRFDRSQYKATLAIISSQLRSLRDEMNLLFGPLLEEYSRAYDQWLFGSQPGAGNG